MAEHGMEFTEVKPASMTLLRPKPGLCQECAVDHPPDQPHNAQSLYYGVKFKMEHGRDATWADAVAHCAPEVREAWERELRKIGHWSEPAKV